MMKRLSALGTMLPLIILAICFSQAAAQETAETAESLYAQSRASYLAGDYAKAYPYLEKATIKDPNFAPAWADLGYCLAKLERWQESVTASERAIKLQPNNVWVHENLGWAYGRLGRWEKTVEVCKKTIGLNPNSS